MKTLFTHAKAVLAHNILPDAAVLVEDGIISKIVKQKDIDLQCADRVIDAGGQYLSPGFIDIHVHGGGNANFYDGTEEAFITGASTHLKYGTTSMVCTLSSSSRERLMQCIHIFNGLKEREHTLTGLPNLLGLHIEGPYFSQAARGAQNAAQLRNPDPAEYMEILDSTRHLLIWASACELPGALQFARDITARGVIASIGHSDAEFYEVQKAIDYGYQSITHFYSGCSHVHRIGPWRHAGVVEAGYLFDDLWVEMIADGCHLPEPLLKLIYKVKGPDSICLITDSIRAGGVENPEEVYKEGSAQDASGFFVQDDVAIVPDRTAFAGSIATTNRLVRTMRDIAAVPLADAVRMASLTPARKLGIDGQKGSIAVGKDADLVLFNENVDVSLVLVGGSIAYRK